MLKESPEALDYLARRGLQHHELLETFQLGFANRTLSYRLPLKNREAGAELRSRLQGLGILRESGHEHMNGSLVVPIFDEDGQVDFKGKAKAFTRTYGFLASILPYTHAEWEKLSIFLSFLVPKLPAPVEEDLSKGILEAIDMDSYRVDWRW